MPHQSSLLVAVLLASSALAQTPEDELRSKVRDVRYPPLAKAARIQGDVRLRLSSGTVKSLSGHQLLVQAASGSANELGSMLPMADLDLMYHFVIIEATNLASSATVKSGNAFERTVLRMLRLETEKVEISYLCEDGVAPPNDFRMADTRVELWIYGGASRPMI